MTIGHRTEDGFMAVPERVATSLVRFDPYGAVFYTLIFLFIINRLRDLSKNI